MRNLRQDQIYDNNELQTALVKSERWMIQCATLIADLNFMSSNRARVAITLYCLSIEHHAGIHTLIDNGVIGSALALFRPQFEAFLRGAWHQHCAEEQRIDEFIHGKEPPKVTSMIQQLEMIESFKDGSLTCIKKDHWNNLCDYTHGGAIQVKARNTLDEVIPNYKPEHIANILKASVTISYLAAVGISSVTDRDDLANKLRDEFISIYGPDD